MIHGQGSPPSVPHEVVRTRVLQLLDRRWEHMVTTVTAGPGFGKSIAVGQAVRANQALPRGVEAWVSCRSGTEDPSRLVDQVRSAFGVWASGSRAAPLAQLQQVAEELAPVDAALILDDVERLDDAPGSVELLDQLLRDLPWNLHVVLCGRRLPRVGLARLRAADQVVQVVDDDLCFDEVEIEALARSVGCPSPSPARQLGGWPALVRLAVGAPPGAVGDFLWDEVIRALAAPDRRALAALCLLGPASAADLEAVCQATFDATAFCERVPLVHQADGQLVAHALWAPFADRLVPAEEQASIGQRAVTITAARGDVVATGSLAIRLGDGATLRAAAVGLVRESLTNLPVDLSAAWIDAAGDDPAPEIELLACALAHARDAAEPPPPRLDALAAAFRERSDTNGEGVVLALSAITADATGDFARLPALAGRAHDLATTGDDPLLWALADGVQSVLAAWGGDLAGALRLLEHPRGDAHSVPRIETVDLLHWRLLLLTGRADDAARLATDDELRAVARWLDGDPSGLAVDDVDIGAERYAGVGERERFDRASFVAMLAVAAGDPGPVDMAVEVLTASPLAQASPSNAARVAAAVAAQRVAHHDDAGAAAAIADFLRDQPPALDPNSEAFLRRSLGVPYVCSAALRQRWDAADLGPSQRRARAIAALLVAARAGDTSLAAGPASIPAVCTVLPLPWSVELAARAAARRLPWGVALAEDLADRFGPVVRSELAHVAAGENGQLQQGAAALQRMLPALPSSAVAVAVLGPLEVARDDEPAHAPGLRRARVRSLLSALVAERSLTRERVMDLLWPDLDEPKARANLRVTLTHLQRLFEPDRPAGAAPYFVRADTERLRLAEVPELTVDLWEAERHLRDADAARQAGDATARIGHLDAAVALWRGRPLQDLDGLPALASAGAYLANRLADACLALGELELTRGVVSRVVDCAERVLAADPYQERAHRLSVAVALQARDRAALRAARDRLQAMLDDLGVDPDESTQMLLRQAAAWDPPPN